MINLEEIEEQEIDLNKVYDYAAFPDKASGGVITVIHLTAKVR